MINGMKWTTDVISKGKKVKNAISDTIIKNKVDIFLGKFLFLFKVIE